MHKEVIGDVMKEITINLDNLSKDKVDDIKYKARAIILNKNDEMLITVNGGVYLLPGGSMIPGEDYITGVKREVLEETGIDMDESKIISLASYEEYVTNFPKRDGITFVSRYTKTVYFFYNNKEDIHEDRINLSDNEKKGKFYYLWIRPEEIESLLENNPDETNLKRAYFDRELLTIIDEYCEIKNDFPKYKSKH